MALDTVDIWILKAKEAYNLVTNPSFETGTSGYTTVLSTVARSRSYQRRGAYSLEITPNTGVASGVYFGTVALAAGTKYTYSADVLGVAGQAMRLEFRDTSANVLATQLFTASGYWQRIALSYTEASGASRRIYLIRDAVASTAKIYTDGWQCESGNESSYIDGDLHGFLRFSTDYKWVGAPHASQSWRSGTTKAGGEMVKLSTYCTILALIGLGMAPLSNVSTPWRLYGSDYQSTVINDREFTIPVLVYGDNFSTIQTAKKAISDLVRPDAGTLDQPITMMFQVKDSAGVEKSERCAINCFYESGLEGEAVNQRAEVAPLKFKAFLPLLFGDGERAFQLTFQTSLTANYLLHRKTTGVWENIITSAGGTLPSVYKSRKSTYDGLLYIGGSFSSLNGVANTGSIATWDGAAIGALGTGMHSASTMYVGSIAFGPDGKMYAGGLFDDAGGVANTANIAVWTGSAWASLGTGGANGAVFGLGFTANGNLIAYGNFTTIGGVAANYIAEYNGATWSALGTGMSAAVQTVSIYGNTIYAGGGFVTAGGVTVNRAAKWNGTAWSAFGSGANAGTIYTVFYDSQTGRLYINGTFSTFNGVASAGTGFWNGTAWENIISNGPVSLSAGALHKDKNGAMYFLAGSTTLYTSSGTITLPDKFFVYKGGAVFPAEFDLPGAAIMRDIFFEPDNSMWVSFDTSGTAVVSATNAVGTANNASNSLAAPRFVIKGPGSLWRIANETTGQVITFANLTLLAGETLTLDLTVGNTSFISDFRGNMMSYIFPGSNMDLALKPGNNDVNVYITGSTAATDISMFWREYYWSLDGAQK